MSQEEKLTFERVWEIIKTEALVRCLAEDLPKGKAKFYPENLCRVTRIVFLLLRNESHRERSLAQISYYCEHATDHNLVDVWRLEECSPRRGSSGEWDEAKKMVRQAILDWQQEHPVWLTPKSTAAFFRLPDRRSAAITCASILWLPHYYRIEAELSGQTGQPKGTKALPWHHDRLCGFMRVQQRPWDQLTGPVVIS